MPALPEKIIEFRIIRLKDERAYEQFYDHTAPQIRQYLLSRSGDAELAKDITNDAFIELWHMLFVRGSGYKVSNLRGLIFIIAKRLLFNHFREQARHPVIADEFIEQDVAADNKLFETLDVSIDLMDLRRELAALAAQYREIITLRFMDELEIGEIADLLGKSQGAVRVLLHRAVKELRKRVRLSEN